MFLSNTMNNSSPQPRYRVDSLNGLVSRWNFEEGSGVAVGDSVGSNNLTASGGMGWTTGKVGSYCGTFDNNNDIASVGSTSGLALNFFTVMCWVYRDNSDSDTVVSLDNISGQRGWYLQDTGSGRFKLLVGKASPDEYIHTYQTSEATPVGQWTHWAVSHDSTGDVKLYLDGNLELTVAAVAPIAYTNSTPALTIGRSTSGTNPHGGKLDDVRIYNTIVSGLEIKDIYDIYK
jgi:hypothetical protein